jgi:ABC-2 type transport system ATP-binding protein
MPDVPLGGSDSPRYHNEIKQDQSKFVWQNRSGRPMNPVPLVILSPVPFLPIHERQLRPNPFSYHILSMPDATPAIAVRDLRKVYDGKAAVDGLSLTVPRGSFFGFLGPNGAGKSTTIRMLTGLIPATSGSIELLGLPMPAEELSIKQRIGLVPDESLLFDRLTGAEFLEFVGRMYNLPRPLATQRAQELLELFELANERRKLIAEYSKGMRKRVAMAASLIHRPELFLMDEPFEGVDAVGARLMKDILLDQVRHGATIFLTSHVLEVVERLCDHAAIINEGRIVAEGRMQDLRAGSETLEDVFVRVVGRGAGREYDKLEWLG